MIGLFLYEYLCCQLVIVIAFVSVTAKTKTKTRSKQRQGQKASKDTWLTHEYNTEISDIFFLKYIWLNRNKYGPLRRSVVRRLQQRFQHHADIQYDTTYSYFAVSLGDRMDFGDAILEKHCSVLLVR